jgi:UDP-MurNAc hydroxylase
VQLQFFANACVVVESFGFRLLTDPWLVDGAFDGSWCHAPGLTTKPADLRNVDALYISHLHPDHLDQRSLEYVPRHVPVVCLDEPSNPLPKLLASMGFERIVGVRDGVSTRLGPFELTMYRPFVRNVFADSEVGNLIDSAIVVSDGLRTLINFNDNNPTVEVARELMRRHGPLAAVLVPYGSAGPYPSCFSQLGSTLMRRESRRIIERNLVHFAQVTDALEARYLMPFAGSYALGGKLWHYNEFLATPSWDRAAEYIAHALPQQAVLLMQEGQRFDLDNGEYIEGDYRPIDEAARDRYIRETLSQVTFPYEDDPELDERELESALRDAREHLWKYQSSLGYRSEWTFALEPKGYGRSFAIRFDSPDGGWVERLEAPYVKAELDPRLLMRVLDRRTNWNNVEIGCHAKFERAPNAWLPDLHTMMAFFHR